ELGDARLQPGPRVADDPAPRAPGLPFPEPGRTAAIVGPLPRNQTMLWGSTPTRTGRRWKKISSRQPTRTSARQERSRDLSTRPAAVAAAWPHRGTVERLGAARAPRRMASKARIWLRLKPMARAVTANCCCRARGDSMV